MSALDHAIGEILGAPHNTRNNTFYAQARWLFESAAGGDLEFEVVREHLSSAAQQIGLSKAETRASLRSSERDGRKNPKSGRRRRKDGPAPALVLQPDPPKYPPHRVWSALWEAAEGVFQHDEAIAWLHSRGINLERASGANLCRYLPSGARFPNDLLGELRDAIPRVAVDDVWKHAPLYGFRLLFRLYDSMGDARSLSLRGLVDHGEKLKTKAVPLKPNKRGLVLANRWGVVALRRDPARRELWANRPVEYIVVEGEPDLLTAACEDTGDDRVRVVFGITGHGAWTDAHAIAIPQDAHVIIATDDDEPGDQHAAKINATLSGRRVSRWKPFIKGQDVCDAGGLAGGALR